MLAPRLAMLMKGTAWAQIKSADTAKLADPDQGIQVLLSAVATWEEAAELQTYDKFEKALYRIIQKADETNMSFVNRLNVAFMELGEVNVKDMKAFILLRQSSLTADDKRKVIVMTNGKMEAEKIEAAMRTLYTKVMGSNSTSDSKRKVYPVNYMDDEPEEVHHVAEEEHFDEDWILQTLVDQGDEDAQVVADFEDQLVEVCQESPELSLCFSAYSEARGRIRDKIKSRGFWPAKGKGKGPRKGFSGKGGGKRRQSLADRIAASHCRVCGQKGHWKWECPKRGGSSTTASNGDVNMALEVKSSSVAEEIIHDLPSSSSPLELHDLLFGHQDCQKKCLNSHPSLEFSGSQIEDSCVNEEFIFMTEFKIGTINNFEVVRSLNLANLENRLKGIVGISSSRTSCDCETVLSAEVGCPGIIDTGASKSVIGQRKVKRLIESLPISVRSKVQWGKSDTVFRFGNNGTLSSVGALYLPIGCRWMRLEVVAGETPFLLSNAFLKSTSADVLSGSNEL